MGNTMTAEESRDECIKIMGEPLGKQYAALWQELAWVHAKWSEYVELFGAQQSRIDLLNKGRAGFL